MSDQELEELGREIARKTDWDGIAILKVMAEALTDANFHREAEVADKMRDILENTDDTPHYKLEKVDKDATKS